MQAKTTLGSKIEIGVGSPIVYYPILGARNLDGPTVQVKDLDATGVADLTPFYIADMPDWQPVTFEVPWDSTDTYHTALKTSYDTKDDATAWKITLTDAGAAVMTFVGAVTTFEMSGAVGGLVTVRVGITIDGNVTIA